MSDPVPRKTRQKAAIRGVFEAHDRPLSPQEVLDFAQTEVAGLGIATVYRNLKALVQEGWLTPVEMPGGAVLYEMAGKNHHHHFQCDRCHRVFEVNGCVSAVNRLAGSGFKVQRHELILYGICPACRGHRRN
jgi:Fur family ferric uptake transcriptional regulator